MPAENPICLLLVDDDEDFLASLSKTLRNEGLVVETATCGPEAVAKVQQESQRFHVAVIDQIMPPPLDGIETMRRIQQMNPAIEAIILTGKSDVEVGLAAMEAGAYRYMGKPFETPELLLTIQVAARFSRERRQRTILQYINDITRSLQGAMSSEELVAKILAGIQALGYDRARIYLLNRERTMIQGWAHVGSTTIPFDQIKIPVDEPYTKHLFAAKAPCIFHKGQYPDPYQDILDKRDLQEWGELPLVWEGTIIGKLTVANQSSPRPLTAQDLDDLLAFAAQAAAAIVRAQRTEESRQALRGLVQAGEAMNRASTEDELYECIWTQVQHLLPDVNSFVVSQYDDDSQVVSFPFARVQGRPFQELSPRRGYKGLIEHVLQTRQPLLLPQGDRAFREEHGLDPPLPEFGFSASLMVVPMFLDGKAIGTMTAQTKSTGVQYTTEHLTVFQSLANLAAVTRQRIRQLEESRELQQASSALAVQRGQDAVLRTIVTQAHRLIGADYTGLILQDRKGRLSKAHPTEPDSFYDLFEEPRQQGGLSRWVIENRRAKIIPDTSLDPLVKQGVRDAGIRSMTAMPLIHGDRVLGVLFAHARQPRHFSAHDVNLWEAFAAQAAVALSSAQDDERLNQRLRAILTIFNAFRHNRPVNPVLQSVADAVVGALDVDLCSIVECREGERTITERVVAGESLAPRRPRERAGSSLRRLDFAHHFLGDPGPHAIEDVHQDPRLAKSDFIRREKIQSVVIHPLRVDDQRLGLFFANYRTPRKPSQDEIAALGLFADLAALVLHGTRLREQLNTAQKQLERRRFLNWVATLESSWQHTLVQKLAAIRNYTTLLLRRLPPECPEAMRDIPGIVAEIDRLAAELGAARPQVPQSWEEEQEIFPLAPLLEEVAARESKPASLTAPAVRIEVDVGDLRGAQLRGYRRWLIYCLEALINNSRNAMPAGGTMMIRGSQKQGWATVRLADSGKGIPMHVQDRLFKERIAKKQDEVGMGIGCLLAAHIVEEIGGTIEIEKTGPSGTTVLIRLPLAKGREDAHQHHRGDGK